MPRGMPVQWTSVNCKSAQTSERLALTSFASLVRSLRALLTFSPLALALAARACSTNPCAFSTRPAGSSFAQIKLSCAALRQDTAMQAACVRAQELSEWPSQMFWGRTG